MKKLQEKRSKQEEVSETKRQERAKDFEAPEEEVYENKLLKKEKKDKKEKEGQEREKKDKRIRRRKDHTMMKTIHLSLRNLSINEMIRFVVLYVWKTISGPNSISFSSLQSMNINHYSIYLFTLITCQAKGSTTRKRHFSFSCCNVTL